jgi:phage terminase large subunit-like protein
VSDLDPRRRVVTSVPSRRLPADPVLRAVRVVQGLVVPRGHGARKRLRLLPWQRKAVVEPVFGRRLPQVAVSVPRGSGKSTLAAAVAVYAATWDGVPDAVVPLVGVNEAQALRLLWIARRFVEQDPVLSTRARVYGDRIRFPCWHSEIVALPAEPAGLLGLDYSLAVVDEIGAVPREVWDAVASGGGKRPGATVLAIGSPVPGASDLLRDLLDAEGVHSTRFAAPDGCKVDDRAAWRAANPSYGRLVDEATLQNLCETTPEATFRAFRLGQFVEMAGVWCPLDRWSARVDAARVIPDGTDIALGFDGSFAHDATALIGATRDGHVFVIDVWEPPAGQVGWRVPRREVDQAVDAAFDRFSVRRMNCDPYIWRDAIERWSDKYGAEVVLEYPTTSWARMAKAAERFLTGVLDGSLTHDGDSRLARHVANCHVKVTPFGPVPVKDAKDSPRRIDAAIAAIAAFDGVAQLPDPPRSKRLVTF